MYVEILSLNYMKQLSTTTYSVIILKVQSELSLHVHVCTVQPLCVHVMCFNEPAFIPKISSLMKLLFVVFFVQVTSRSISSTSQFWMDMTVFLLMRLRIVLLVKLSLFTCYRLGNYNSSDTLTINLTHRRSVRSFFFCGR